MKIPIAMESNEAFILGFMEQAMKTQRYQIVHNNPEDGDLAEPYFDTLEDAQREATRLVNALPTAWFWIFDCQDKCKVQEFEKDWEGTRY